MSASNVTASSANTVARPGFQKRLNGERLPRFRSSAKSTRKRISWMSM